MPDIFKMLEVKWLNRNRNWKNRKNWHDLLQPRKIYYPTWKTFCFETLSEMSMFNPNSDFCSFTLYPGWSRVSRKNWVLRHCIVPLSFPRSNEFYGHYVLGGDTRRSMSRYHSDEMKILNILFTRMGIKPPGHTLMPLRHDWPLTNTNFRDMWRWVP